MKKRIFSFLLALALLLTTFAAFGMDGAAADSARDVQLFGASEISSSARIR